MKADLSAPLFWRSRYAIGLVVFGAIAMYFLPSEHRAHFLGALPFLFLLACPFMHIFMHGGHGRHWDGYADWEADQMNQKTSTVSQAAVRRVCTCPAGVFVVVANTADAGDVPDLADHVRAARRHGRG